MLRAQHLTLAYDQHTVSNDVSFNVTEGKISVLIGANGCGKSTLLKALARQLVPNHGQIVLNGKAAANYGSKEFARYLAMLAQSPIVPEGISVKQLVRYGRYPYRSFASGWKEEDECAVTRALQLTATDILSDKTIDSLSGGQRQRVWIAMALAQDTPYLLLDEPTTYLDLTYQIDILDLLKQLNRDTGTTIVMVLHDLNLACRYADEMIAMHKGNIAARGSVHEIINENTVRQVFGLESRIVIDPIYGTPMCIPLGKHFTE
ncbi:ABC transporter ATP-binding protein [Neisseria iguanae]|nr:ABC transporter ATP-binding protein [Neisseria iguanae]